MKKMPQDYGHWYLKMHGGKLLLLLVVVILSQFDLPTSRAVVVPFSNSH